jgi:hypothetical protein
MKAEQWKMNNEQWVRAQRGPFPLNVARIISTTRVTRMKSMRNLAMGMGEAES